MKIKPIESFVWKLEMPEFIKNEVYEVEDELGEQMIKHGYAELVCEEKKEEKKIDAPENKMIDTSIESNKESKEKKHKKPGDKLKKRHKNK